MSCNEQVPSSRIKLKVKKKKKSESCFQSKSCFDALKPSNEQQDGGCSTGKRSNPFGCSSVPNKRPSQSHSTDSKLFKALNNEIEEYGYSNEDACGAMNCSVSKASVWCEETDNLHDTQQGQEMLPLDWSLKTKVRFTSSRSFSWAAPSLKSAELADSVTSFVRCQEDVSSSASLLFKESKVWMHPSLPWLQLFPRTSNIKSLGNGGDDQQLLNALQQDWVASFHSVFNLLRCGHCAYFYLCTNHCTMVFITAGIHSEESVVITPTTQGFRDALIREGIEFTLPHEKELSGSGDICQHENETDNDCDDEEWLHSMGLEKEHFPSLDKHSRHQTSDIRNKDQHPNSTVIVQGSNTLALSNFILNWKSITATGVPPTLISPVAFEGATLRSHKISHGMLKHHQNNSMQQLFSLEVSGAILPGCLQRICKLVQTFQSGEFTATLTPILATAAFNTCKDDMPAATPYGLTTSLLEEKPA